MSNEEVLVTPINSVEMNGSGQVEAISNIISQGLLGTTNTQNEENIPTENQNDNSNQITTPKRKSSKHSHKKKLTAAERLARCAIAKNRVILDVEPDAEHAKIRKRPRRVRTYGSYEEYLAAKLKKQDLQNPDESDIVSKSEFYMSDDDTEEFEEIQINEKSILDTLLLEEKDTKRKDIQEEQFELTSYPHIECDIKPDRNSCYDDVSAAIDRGMPGNPLEKEIEEQEAREQREHEQDLQNFAMMQYPESPLATQLGLNFNSDFIRNDFGANPAFNESAFSVSEMNSDLISISPRSPRGLSQKMRNVCFTGTLTLLSVLPDDEKVAEYQEQKEDSKHYTHVRRYRTTDKTNELNASLGSMSGSISNVKLESKSTLAVFTDSEENLKTEEGLSLSQALTEERDIEEEKLKKTESKDLRDALNEEKNNHVIEGSGLSYSSSHLSAEFRDLTIYSDSEKLKLSEEEHLKDEIEEEYQTILEQKAYREHQKEIWKQEEELRKIELLKRIAEPDIPPNDVTPNGDGTTDVGIQSVRCDIEDLVNRRPSRRVRRRRRQEELPSVYTELYAIQPRVLLNIKPDRNACYDNYNDAIDRGVPGNPLEDEIEELEEKERKEKQDDEDYYNTIIYNERALKEGLQQSVNSDVLRDEFGNRPPMEETHIDIIIEEEEEADYASQSDSETIAPPVEMPTTSPRLKRRVKKPVLKTFEVQCELIHASPLEEARSLPMPPKEEEHHEVTPDAPKEEPQVEPHEEPHEEIPEKTNDDEDQEATTRSLNPTDENQPQMTLGALGEQMKDALTLEGGSDDEHHEPNNTDGGELEKQTEKLNSLFSIPTPIPDQPTNDEEQPKLDDPIKETLRDIPPPDDDGENEQKSVPQPLDPMSILLKSTNDDADIPKPDIPESQKLNTEEIEDTTEKLASTISQEANPLSDLPVSLIKLTGTTNNDNSEVSDTLPRIQMPADTDSERLSPRTKSARPGSFRTSTRRSPRYSYRSFEPASPSITRLRERAMKLEPIANATNDQLELLIDDIEKERRQMMRERRFKDGLKCNAAIKHVEAILSKQQLEQSASNPNEQLEIAFDNESRKQEQELLDKQRMARRKLRAKHKKELDDLDKQWNSIQVRKKYNKPSEKLIELKKQYDAMAAAGNPDDEEELNKLNEEITRLRQFETEEAHQRMQKDYDSALLHLQKKQQQDFALLQESANVKMEQLKQQRAREKRALDFNRDNPISSNNDNLLGAQSEELMSDSIGNLIDHSDTNKNVDKNDGEKLNLPPLDTRKPKSLRFAKPDSS